MGLIVLDLLTHPDFAAGKSDIVSASGILHNRGRGIYRGKPDCADVDDMEAWHPQVDELGRPATLEPSRV